MTISLLVFSSPESILPITKRRDLLTSPPYKNLELFVVDEAHTVLQWGESANGDNPFREWYAKLGEIRSLTECPVLLITATANAAARKCMRKKFCMVNYIEIIDNPDRETFFKESQKQCAFRNFFISDYCCEKGEREVSTVYSILYVHKNLW